MRYLTRPFPWGFAAGPEKMAKKIIDGMDTPRELLSNKYSCKTSGSAALRLVTFVTANQ
jgi:hypothetical protein